MSLQLAYQFGAALTFFTAVYLLAGVALRHLRWLAERRRRQSFNSDHLGRIRLGANEKRPRRW